LEQIPFFVWIEKYANDKNKIIRAKIWFNRLFYKMMGFYNKEK